MLEAFEGTAFHQALRTAGANIALVAPDGTLFRVGALPETATVRLREAICVRHLVRGDHFALAKDFLRGAIDVEGDLRELLRLALHVDLQPSRWMLLVRGLRSTLLGGRRVSRDSISFHYDRPPDFFLPWLDRWRSYSHGFYHAPDDDLEAAQARKLQYAIDALGLRPGMRVFDMGGGWGCFSEYAGLRGIEVHSITISAAQHAFVGQLIRERQLPCTIKRVDFRDYRPPEAIAAEGFDAAVFMGTLEHMSDYPFVGRFLASHLRPGGRVYADFCAQRASHQVGAFLHDYIWPGAASYVNVPALVDALMRSGHNLLALEDDTLSYAYTVRDWALRLERERKPLAEAYGEAAVRAFLLFLWGSYHFLDENRTQAYHLVAQLGAAPRCEPSSRPAAPPADGD